MPTLAERLEALRKERFIGRSPELSFFEAVLHQKELPYAVLYLYGPGGVGKTTLLHQFVQMAGQAGYDVCLLDGRNLDASPDALGLALQELTVDHADGGDAKGQCQVLLIDTMELLTPLEDWLYQTFLPALPDQTLVVFAGRNPPSAHWRSDPGWQAIMHLMPVSNFKPEESRAFLEQRHVPQSAHNQVMDFTHGYPLALSLVAEVFSQRPKTTFDIQSEPDIIKVLVERFTKDAPTPKHRAALEASSQVMFINEPLLKAMVEVDDPYPLLDWLRDLSFFEANESGLFPHDLAREALSADLRWRNPQSQGVFHDRARSYYLDQVRTGSDRRQRQVLNEYIFLHRDNPIIKQFYDWRTSGVVYTDRATENEWQGMLQMIQSFEGQTSADIAGHWLQRQPENAFVIRKNAEEVQGLLMTVDLDKSSEADRQADPCLRAAWNFLQQQAPLRPGETATVFRFWMDKDGYQTVSSAQSRIFLNIVQYFLITPRLAYTFLPCAEPQFWTDLFNFVDMHLVQAAEFSVGGKSYGVYGHDWRAVPPLVWLEALAARELDPQVEVEIATTPPAIAVLDEDAFKKAVRQALNDFTNPLALKENPLLQTRMMTHEIEGDGGDQGAVELLQEKLLLLVDTLDSNPRQQKWHRVLVHTYIQPSGTQEETAERLDLPFSTYRRHLQSGIQQVAELMWHEEIGAQPL